MNFSEYTERWEKNILPLKTPSTGVTFRSHIRKMNRYLGQLDLTEITESRVQDHVSELAQNLSPKGLKNYIGTMKLILSRAKKEGLIQVIPDPDLPKIVKKQQPWFTAEQMKNIVEHSDGQYKLLFYLLAETGMRIGEALGLQWQDIDFKNQSINIQRSVFNGQTQNPKTSSSIRSISISFNLVSKLSLHGNSENFLFTTSKNNPCAANAILVQKLHPRLQDFNYPSCGFHAFRRGNATIMASIGTPEKIAACRLGHALPGITFGLYAQNVQFADRDWVEKIAMQIC